jgi:hypothetical protein
VPKLPAPNTPTVFIFYVWLWLFTIGFLLWFFDIYGTLPTTYGYSWL